MALRQRVVGLPLHAGARIPEALLEQAHVGMVQLLFLAQHVLAHADLAEVVQQRGIADLAQLLLAEATRRSAGSAARSSATASDSA
jgi:hypothetical protein